MNNSKRSVVAAFASFILAMFVVSPIAIAICFPPSSYAHEENKIKHFVSTYENDDYPTKPTCEIDQNTYNVAVAFKWRAGSNSDDLALSRSGSVYNLMGSTAYNNYAFVDDTSGTTACTPSYSYGKSYNSTSRAYSDSLQISIEHPTYTQYSFYAKYPAVGQFRYWLFGPDANIPTSFNKDEYTWEHHGTSAHKIVATVMFDSTIVNLEYDIPFLFPQKHTRQFGDLKLSVRVTSERCSIRMEQSNVKAYRLRFMFGVTPQTP